MYRGGTSKQPEIFDVYDQFDYSGSKRMSENIRQIWPYVLIQVKYVLTQVDVCVYTVGRNILNWYPKQNFPVKQNGP